MRILAICGSLQAESSNQRLLAIAQELAGRDVDVVVARSLAEIPAFNPDIEPAPASVAELRAELQRADGVLFATPEYAHGMPGALKNALDWMVGSGDLYGKRVVIIAGAPSDERAQLARADLERTLRAQGAEVLWSATIGTRTNDDDAIRAAVGDALAAF